MADWDKIKALLEETKALKATGQLDSNAFDSILERAIAECGAGRFVEAFFKFAPPEWIDKNIQLPLKYTKRANKETRTP